MGDMTRVRAYGIKQPGWYVARWVWDAEYAKHLESLGYQVVRSINKPDTAGAA